MPYITPGPPAPITPGGVPGLSPAISQWQSADNALNSINAYYQNELQYLLCTVMGKEHNPALALWLFQLKCMPAITGASQFQLQKQADALNIATAIRSDITGAQNYYNEIIADLQAKGMTAAAKAAALQLSKSLANISKDLHVAGITQILGTGGISSISGFIAGLRAGLYGPSNKQYSKQHTMRISGITHIRWRSVVTMYGPVPAYTYKSRTSHWNRTSIQHCFYNASEGIYSNLASIYNQAAKSGQPVPPQFTTITSSFNNLNQSVSSVSTTIQAQIQYLNQNLQQYFGVYKSFFDQFSQLSSYIVNKSNQG